MSAKKPANINKEGFIRAVENSNYFGSKELAAQIEEAAELLTDDEFFDVKPIKELMKTLHGERRWRWGLSLEGKIKIFNEVVDFKLKDDEWRESLLPQIEKKRDEIAKEGRTAGENSEGSGDKKASKKDKRRYQFTGINYKGTTINGAVTLDGCFVLSIGNRGEYTSDKMSEEQVEKLCEQGFFKKMIAKIAEATKDELSDSDFSRAIIKTINQAAEAQSKTYEAFGQSIESYLDGIKNGIVDIKNDINDIKSKVGKIEKETKEAHQKQNEKLDNIEYNSEETKQGIHALQEQVGALSGQLGNALEMLYSIENFAYNDKNGYTTYADKEVAAVLNEQRRYGGVVVNIEFKIGEESYCEQKDPNASLNIKDVEFMKLLAIALTEEKRHNRNGNIDIVKTFLERVKGMLGTVNRDLEGKDIKEALQEYVETLKKGDNTDDVEYDENLVGKLSEKYGIKIEKAEKDEDGNISLVIKGEEVNSEAFVNVHDIKEIEFRKVKRISNGAISRCMALKSVKFPSATNDIGECAIAECDALEELTVARNNTKYRSVNNCVIDIKAHQLVLGCKSSVIPDDGSVLSIRAFAFSGYNGLDIKIPACIETIQDFAFYNCYGTITCDVAIQPEGWGKEWQSGEAKVEWQEEQYNQDPYEEEPDYGEDVDDEEEDPTPTVTFDNVCKDEKYRLFVGLKSILSFYIMLFACELVIFAMISGTSLLSLIGACIAVFGMIVWVLLNSFSRWRRELEKERLKVIQKRYKGFLCISAITFVVLMLVSAVLPTANIPIWVFVYLLPCVGAVVMLIVAIITLEKFKANRAYSVNAVVSVLILVLSCCTFIGQAKVGGWLNWNDSVTHYGANAYFDDGLYLQRKDGQLIIVGTSDNLTNVTIPDGVTSIDDSTFRGCSDLTSIVVEDGNPVYHSAGNCLIETATKTLILGCKTSVIPDDGSVTSIGDYAFYNRSGLTSVTIPDSVMSIGYNAFYGCSGLTSVTIPDSVTSISDWAFSGCSGLTSITIPDSVTSIGSTAFYGCTGLTSIVVEDGNPVYHSAGNCIIETDSKTLILGCKTSVIPDDGSVTSIGDIAFSSCSGLTSITIPDSVTSIGYNAFSGCTGLTSIVVEDGNPVYHSAGNCIIETDSKTLILGCKTSVIPDDGRVTSIGSSAFYECTGLTSITIPDSVTSIGSSAFHGCTGLTSITIPDSVTSIGAWAFSGCNSDIADIEDDISYVDGWVIDCDTSVTKAKLRDTTKGIAGSAFSGCSGLTSITIPDSVTSIGDWAFSGCSGLTSLKIPDSVTSIGDMAFSSCSGLTSITIPDSVTSIGNWAFDGCSGLTSITIPFVGEKLDGTGETSFDHIFGIGVPDSLKEVVITGGASIGDRAFYRCSGLTSITIPDSVTSIGEFAFYDCSGLITINFQGTKAQWKAIEKDSRWDLSTGDYTIYCTDGTISKADA